MYGFSDGGAHKRLRTAIVLALLGFGFFWLGFRVPPPQPARDFEECIEQAQAGARADDQHGALMTDCNARFAGRRKPAGGYTYYDFMQDRKFDIAGPNPTAEERKQIDRAYMDFLDAQQREAVSAEFAKRQNEQLRADMERARQPAGPALVLKPREVLPLPVKRPVDRSKSPRCEDGSLTCSWAKFSAVVKNAFASSTRTKP